MLLCAAYIFKLIYIYKGVHKLKFAFQNPRKKQTSCPRCHSCGLPADLGILKFCSLWWCTRGHHRTGTKYLIINNPGPHLRILLQGDLDVPNDAVFFYFSKILLRQPETSTKFREKNGETPRSPRTASSSLSLIKNLSLRKPATYESNILKKQRSKRVYSITIT